MSFEESLGIVRKLSEGRIKRDPNAKAYKYVSPPPTATPVRAIETAAMSDPPAGPAGADVVYVNDESDDSNNA